MTNLFKSVVLPINPTGIPKTPPPFKVFIDEQRGDGKKVALINGKSGKLIGFVVYEAGADVGDLYTLGCKKLKQISMDSQVVAIRDALLRYIMTYTS